MIDSRRFRSKIFNEFNDDETRKYFDFKQKKVIHNMDNIYYSVFIRGDSPSNELDGLNRLLNILIAFKEDSEKGFEGAYWFDYDKKVIFKSKGHAFYKFCLSQEGNFDIFISKSLPNEFTPRILVQIRSELIWSVGQISALKTSFDYLKKLLKKFNLEVLRVQENRLDYAFHTNWIQDPESYFSDENVKKHLYSNLKKICKVGEFLPGRLDWDYLSLGKRQSNNIFFRTYNKVREILDESHKYYFFDIWYSYGLISYYDYWIYTFLSSQSVRKSYCSIPFAQAEFYIKFGKNEVLKKQLKKLIDNPDISAEYMRNYIKGICPYPTTIINIEFQTMRKFYYYSDQIIDMLPCNIYGEPLLDRMFKILDNKNIFVDYLTSNTVSFVENSLIPKDKDKNFQYTSFWKSIKSCKLEYKADRKFKRIYPGKKINEDKVQNDLRRSLAKFALINGDYDSCFAEDYSSIFNMVNDNNVNSEGVVQFLDKEYEKIKEREKKRLHFK